MSSSQSGLNKEAREKADVKAATLVVEIVGISESGKSALGAILWVAKVRAWVCLSLGFMLLVFNS